MEQLTLEKGKKVPEFAKFPEKGILVVRALKPKTQLPLVLRPCEDSTGRVFTGQGPTGHYETLSKELKEQLSYVITPDTEFRLSDGKVIDLDNDIDRLNWVWVRKHPYLAMTEEEAKSSRDARFYIDDPVVKAERRVLSSKNRDKARYMIQFEAARTRLIKACLLLGNLAADSMTDTAMQDWLLQQTEEIPDLVLKALNPDNTEETDAKILYMELKKYKLIQRGDGGVFRFGGEKGISLGHTEELVIGFMLDEKNSDTVSMMKNTLAQRTQVAK